MKKIIYAIVVWSISQAAVLATNPGFYYPTNANKANPGQAGSAYPTTVNNTDPSTSTNALNRQRLPLSNGNTQVTSSTTTTTSTSAQGQSTGKLGK